MLFSKTLFLSLALAAQPGTGPFPVDEQIRNHIIIVVDERVDSKLNPGDLDIRDKVEQYLYKPIVVSGDTLYGGKPLYGEGDFLSVVTFSLGAGDTSPDAFTGISSFRGTRYKFVPYSKETAVTLHNYWASIAKRRPLTDKRHSIFSIAVPHAMKRCRREEDNQLTNRTFVIMITDRSYSDKTFFDDIRDFTDAQYGQTHAHAITKNDLLGITQQVSKDYFINWVNRNERRYQFWTDHQLRYKNVDLYELQPLQEHLRMPAVIRYPEKIVAKRGRWGKYTAHFTASSEDADRFNVLRLHAELAGSKMTAQSVAFEAAGPDAPFPGVDHSFSLGKRRRKDTALQLRVWANLKDGFYDATVLTPSQEGADYLGKSGLNVTIPIEYEKRARTVFGLLPLWGVFCFSENQTLVATVINILLFLLIFAALHSYIKRNRDFEPTLDEIEITFKNRDRHEHD